jgi:Mce-associated membrane protein
VPSFRRRASVLDADSVEKATEEPDRAAGVEEAKALAEAAEAEAAEAEAMAAAARARARAIRLRKQAEAAEPEAAEPEASEIETDASDVDADTVEATDTEPDSATAFDEGASTDEADDDQDGDVAVGAPEETARKRRRWLPRPSWKRVAVGLSILCICALLAASGYTVWQHRQAVQEQQRSAEFAAAGKQTVVTLMSLNFNRAQEDVQRIIDNSTGQFKDDFQNTADDFVKVAQDAKVTTEVTVTSTAVESMTDDSAVVLVAATSRVTNNAGAQQEPRSWRLSVNLQRDGGQIKMSKVEFVP